MNQPFIRPALLFVTLVDGVLLWLEVIAPRVEQLTGTVGGVLVALAYGLAWLAIVTHLARGPVRRRVA